MSTLSESRAVEMATATISETSSPHDSARASPDPVISGFSKAVLELNRILGQSSGINSDDVEIEELKRVMDNYVSVESEWQKYAYADASRAYTRNLVDRGNGKSNLLLLVWSPGKSSPVHDHADSHCVMKILKGSVTETLYDWPCQSAARTNGTTPLTATSCSSTAHTCRRTGPGQGSEALRVRRVTEYQRDEVAYMSDRLGLHRVGNPSKTEFAVSLHLYTPPNAAKRGCHIFDESTGTKRHIQQCHFYSEYGVKV